MKLIFDSSVFEENYGGLLSADDVRLFYYDIGVDNETRQSFIYQWNDDVESYLTANNIKIDVVERGTIPDDFEGNTILLTMSPIDRENKAVALFRHLRNVFSHYNIGYDGKNFCMKDFSNKDNTDCSMIGKIDRLLLYGLIAIFFQQKAKAEEEENKLFYPDI